MPYKIYIKNKIAWKIGDYIAYVSNNKIVIDFLSDKMAYTTYQSMLTQKMDCLYDGKKRIVQRFKGLPENKLLKQVKLELDTAIKNKVPFQKLTYVIEDIKEESWQEKN